MPLQASTQGSQVCALHDGRTRTEATAEPKSVREGGCSLCLVPTQMLRRWAAREPYGQGSSWCTILGVYVSSTTNHPEFAWD